jgi:type III pantothenate kinase
MTRDASKGAVVDIGNTAIKMCGVADGAVQPAVFTFPVASISGIASQEPLFTASTVVIGCSGQASMATDLAAQIFARGGEAIVIAREAALPFDNRYAAGQAGVDRLANVAAAIECAAGEPAIVIDAGSAVTVEMVARGGVFLGGVILPGFRLQALALNRGTASLPLVDLPKSGGVEWNNGAEDFTLPPTSTLEAIAAGVSLACMGGIEKTVREYLRQESMAGACIIVTGGDGAQVAANLDLGGCITCPRPVAYDPLLTLKGLLLLAKAQQ